MSDASARPIVVFDANVIVSGLISAASAPWQALSVWQQGSCRAVSSDDLFDELISVLQRPRIRAHFHVSADVLARVLSGFAAALVAAVPLDTLPAHCRDADDDHVLACALGGGADYIVTGDADLLVLDGHPALGALRIVVPVVFLAMMKN